MPLSALRRRALSVALAVAISGEPLAQPSRSPERFQLLSTADGLPQNTVQALAEDAQGFIWVGTQDGLGRFDGYEFRRYFANPLDSGALPAGWVRVVQAAAGGGVWVGTRGGGLSRYTPDRDAFEAVNGCGDDVWDLAETPDALWVAAGEDGLCRVRSGRADHVGFLGGEAVYALAVGQRGDVWVGGDGRVTRFRPGAQPETFGVERGVPQGQVTALLVGGNGVWVASLGGLCRMDAMQGQCVRDGALADAPVTALERDVSGDVIAGVEGRGLVRLDARTGEAEAVGDLRALEVLSLLRARSGVWWVGTGGQGLARSRPHAERFLTLAPPPEAPPTAFIVRAFAEADGRVWVGTGAGLLLADARRARLVATPAAGPCVQAPYVRALARGADGGLWVGRIGGGVCRLDPASGASASVSDGLPGLDVYSLHADASGVWAGTDGGLARLPPGAQRFAPVPLGADAPVRAVRPAPGGGFWVATEGAGVVRLDPATGHALRLPSLPGGAAYAALEDARGRVWVSSNRGLARLDPRTGRAAYYTAADGLPSDEFNGGAAYRASGGRLWFGSVGGAVSLDPSAFGVAPFDARPVLTRFEALGSERRHAPAWAARRLVLAPSEDDFVFEFAALGAPAPHRVRYAYRLDGLDGGWLEAGDQRSVVYGNVPPGRYTFRVRAAEGGGRWSPHEAAVEVVVRPRWWQAWWARATALLGAIGVGVALYRWRVRTLLGVERTRRRLADDLHDDLGARLGALAFEIELAGRDERLSAHERDRLTASATAIRAAGADLRDVIWALDVGRDTAAALVDRMESIAYEALRAVPHRVNRPAEVPDLPVGMEVRRVLLMTLRETLHNAVRHGRGARVEVALHASPEAIGFDVRDAGPGLGDGLTAGPDNGTPGRGMRTIRERAERVGGRADIESAPGQGTRVRLQVPLARGRLRTV